MKIKETPTKCQVWNSFVTGLKLLGQEIVPRKFRQMQGIITIAVSKKNIKIFKLRMWRLDIRNPLYCSLVEVAQKYEINSNEVV